jgi:hypothetical protein
MHKETDSSILTEGIYYTNIDGKITDLYHLKYNPDNPDLFDIDVLVDQTSGNQYDKDFLINILNQDNYYHPFQRKIISYKDRNNVDLLIDTLHRFYSNISFGISRQTNPIPSNNSRMLTKLRQRQRILPVTRKYNHHQRQFCYGYRPHGI